VETWKGFIELQRDGLVRSIGVSNFQPAHLQRVIRETGVTPAVNQVENTPSPPLLKHALTELAIASPRSRKRGEPERSRRALSGRCA